MSQLVEVGRKHHESDPYEYVLISNEHDGYDPLIRMQWQLGWYNRRRPNRKVGGVAPATAHTNHQTSAQERTSGRLTKINADLSQKL